MEGSFDEYAMLRMADVTSIGIGFEVTSGQDRLDLAGEVTVGAIGPAVGNAIFAATGKRLRFTPIRKHDSSWT